MAETATKEKPKSGPSVEERLTAIEAQLGIVPAEAPPENAVPGEPLKPHELYSPPEAEE